MIDGGKLRKAALARGLSLPLFPRRTVLEPLDRLGLFSPVGFLQTNYTPETTWLHPDADFVVWREERNPEHWNLHAFELPWEGHPVLSERYTPWQLLYLGRVLDIATYGLPHPNAFATHLRIRPPDDWVEYRVRAAGDLDEAWRPTIKLLIALQSRFWAYRKNRVTLLHTEGHEGELIDPVEVAERTFDPAALLKRFELGLTDLAGLHWSFLDAAYRLDPAPQLQRILALAPRSTTDKLRGEALRARDLYDAAFMLRRLYHSVTGDWLPASPEPEASTVDANRRRHLPRGKGGDHERRTDLKALLIGAGVYPHAMHVFVEGDTEEVIVRRLLKAVGRQVDVQLTNLRGVDETQRHEAMFRAATTYASRTVLIADREGDIDRALRRLQGQGILTDPDDVLLWGTKECPLSFEEANFTLGELVGAMRRVARNRGGRLRLPVPVLRARFGERLARAATQGRPRPALAGTAIGLAREQEFGAVQISKRELAVELAEVLIRRVRRHGSIRAAGETQPFLARFWVWLVST